MRMDRNVGLILALTKNYWYFQFQIVRQTIEENCLTLSLSKDYLKPQIKKLLYYNSKRPL